LFRKNRIKSYDLNGNIKGIERKGSLSNWNTDIIDNLTYYYNGNQLIAVDDAVLTNNGYDFYDNANFFNGTIPEYEYDANGNVIKDANKGIIGITYNHMNLPKEVYFSKDSKLDYYYDATGNKLRQDVIEAKILTKRTDFISNFVIVNNAPAWINFDEGRVIMDGTAVHFTETHLKDHLGNTRVVFGYKNNALAVKQVNSYYPFGMNIKGLTTRVTIEEAKHPANEYLYNGKMFQDELGLDWLDYGARMYDAVLGRWHSLDPLAEVARRWSPYTYCYNNPIRFIDPDGMVVDDYFNENGVYLGSDKAETDNVKVISQDNWDANKIVDENGLESIDHATGKANSTNFSESNLSEDATLSVYDHYNPTDLEVVAHDHENGSGGLTLSTIRKNGVVTQYIMVKIEGNKNGKIADHANEIVNCFAHEERHYDDLKELGLDGYIATPKDTREQRAVTTQMKHESFSKTRPSFQREVRIYGANHGMLFPMKPLPARVEVN
jgi:RHS repeat-associated protein